MPHLPKLIYVLADGAHARFVERNADTGDFVSFQHMDGSGQLDTLREEQRNEQTGRTFESSGGHRHGVGRDEDVYERAKADFAAQVAGRLSELAAQRKPEGVVLVAPPRLLAPLREGLAASVPVVGELGKDLVKTPDHELGDWLGALAFVPGTKAD
jgi:protein required for attachment to host cells